jgi:ribonucleotide reductase alpha subunit
MYTNITQLIKKGIFIDKDDNVFNLANRLSDKIISYDHYQLFDKELFIRNFKLGNIIFSTPILSDKTKNNFSSCYLFKIDEDKEIYKFLDTELNQLISGGFGLNISSLRLPIKVLNILTSVIEFENNFDKPRVFVSMVTIELFHQNFLSILDHFDLKNANLNTSIYLNICFNNLFFKKLKNNEDWCLLKYDNNLYNSLKYSHNKNFEDIYENAIKDENNIIKKINSKILFHIICEYFTLNQNTYSWNKDAANSRTQFNHETITTTNLCTEIIQSATKDKKTTYCTLGSINVSNMIDDNKLSFEKIKEAVKSLVQSLTIFTLNLDYSFSENPKDISIGICGFYNLITTLKIPYKDSRKLNWQLFQAIYFYAIEESIRLDEYYFKLNKFKLEKFSFELVDIKNHDLKNPINEFGFDFNFEQFRNKYLSNRRLIAIMPTSSTSEILNVFQSFHGPFEKKYMRDNNDRSVIINSLDNFIMSDLTLLEQLQFNYDRQFFIDNSQSNELFYNNKNDNLINQIKEYFIKCYKNEIITYCYYIRINSKMNKHVEKIICESCNL